MTFPFDPERGLIVLPVRIAGPTGEVLVRLALDTGATVTVVSAARLYSIGYDQPSVLTDRTLTTASTRESASMIEVLSVFALGQEKKKFLVVRHTLPPSTHLDGVLGLDFLRGHRLILDFPAGLLTLDGDAT